MLAVTTVFRVWRRAVTPAATSTSLSIVPPWTNPIGLASLGSIWEEMMDFDSLTGFEGLIFYRPPSPRDLALSRRDEGSDFHWLVLSLGARYSSRPRGLEKILRQSRDFFFEKDFNVNVFSRTGIQGRLREPPSIVDLPPCLHPLIVTFVLLHC